MSVFSSPAPVAMTAAIALVSILSACAVYSPTHHENGRNGALMTAAAGDGNGGSFGNAVNRDEHVRNHVRKVREFFESLALELKSADLQDTDPALRALLSKLETSVLFGEADSIFQDHYQPLLMSLHGELTAVSAWDVYGLSELTRQTRSESALARILPLATHLTKDQRDCLEERMVLLAGLYNALCGHGPWAMCPDEMAGTTRSVLTLFNDEVHRLRKELETSSNGHFENLSRIWLDLLVDGKPLTMEMLNFVRRLDGMMTHATFHSFFASAVLFEQISKTEHFTHLRSGPAAVWMVLANNVPVDKAESFVMSTDSGSDSWLRRVGTQQYLVLAAVALNMGASDYVDIVSTRDMLRQFREQSDKSKTLGSFGSELDNSLQ